MSLGPSCQRLTTTHTQTDDIEPSLQSCRGLDLDDKLCCEASEGLRSLFFARVAAGRPLASGRLNLERGWALGGRNSLVVVRRWQVICHSRPRLMRTQWLNGEVAPEGLRNPLSTRLWSRLGVDHYWKGMKWRPQRRKKHMMRYFKQQQVLRMWRHMTAVSADWFLFLVF